MSGVFRKKWFPRAFKRASGTVGTPLVLTGQHANTGFGVFGIHASSTKTLTGVVATTHFGSSLRFNNTFVVHGVSATAHASSVAIGGGAVQGNRTFIIAGITQASLATGIVMLPTSEDHALPGNNYVVATSQYYSIGQVQWNASVKVQDVDWEWYQPAGRTSPLKHIIHILTPGSVSTNITLVFDKWDIGVRSGFKVNSYPVPFGFTGTSIVAERVPPLGVFFTVEYTTVRPGDNARSMFAMFDNMIDDILPNHLLYDSSNGFQTFRPTNYKVFDTSNNHVYEWSGSAWTSLGLLPTNTNFYVKRTRQIVLWNGLGTNIVYTAGDGSSTINEVISDSSPRVYPPFGESIAYNFLKDGFSIGAPANYPSAYEVSTKSGDYDSWVPGI